MPTPAPHESLLRRGFALSVVAVALTTGACSSSSTSSTPAPPGPSPPRPSPPAPVVTAPATTRLGAESGLCQKWSSTPVDLTPLATGGTFFAHGFDGGFGFAVADMDAVPNANIVAVAFDTTGKPRGGVIRLPPEPTASLEDVMATSDGGWLAAWSGSATTGPSGANTVYLVAYDSTGVPVQRGQSLAVPPSDWMESQVLLGATTDGEALAWCGASDCTVGSTTAGGALVTVGASFNSQDEMLLTFASGLLLTVEGGPWDDEDDPRTLRNWSPSGSLVGSASLPDVFFSDPFQDATFAPSADGTADVFAQSDFVGFLSPEVVSLIPTDIPLGGACPLAEASGGGHAHIVVGFTGLLAAPTGGGQDVVEIVDISSSGFRGVVGQAVVPPGPYQEDEATGTTGGGALQLLATPSADAYAVAYPTSAAVFSCLERTP